MDDGKRALGIAAQHLMSLDANFKMARLGDSLAAKELVMQA